MIDQEVKDLVNSIYTRTKLLLLEHKEGFLAIAALLLEKEVIFSDDVERILGPRPGSEKAASGSDGADAGQKEAAEEAPVQGAAEAVDQSAGNAEHNSAGDQSADNAEHNSQEE